MKNNIKKMQTDNENLVIYFIENKTVLNFLFNFNLEEIAIHSNPRASYLRVHQ